MKKVSLLLALTLILSFFTACGGGAGEDSNVRLGFALTATDNTTADTGKIGAIAAAVLVDEKGVILACDLDEIEIKPSMKGGTFADAAELVTKGEKGDSYGMKAISSIQKEWYEQAAAYCKYAVGKTGTELAGMKLTDGKSADADLTAGCTVMVDGFNKAVAAAAANAKEAAASSTDTLNVSITAVRGGKDTEPSYTVNGAAVTIGADGKATACALDEFQQKLTIENGAFKAGAGEIKTKYALKDNYGMKEISGIKLEWYEQADNLAKAIVGKTEADVAAMKLTDGKAADLASSCTIVVDGMIENVKKAMKVEG